MREKDRILWKYHNKWIQFDRWKCILKRDANAYHHIEGKMFLFCISTWCHSADKTIKSIMIRCGDNFLCSKCVYTKFRIECIFFIDSNVSYWWMKRIQLNMKTIKMPHKNRTIFDGVTWASTTTMSHCTAFAYLKIITTTKKTS